MSTLGIVILVYIIIALMCLFLLSSQIDALGFWLWFFVMISFPLNIVVLISVIVCKFIDRNKEIK